MVFKVSNYKDSILILLGIVILYVFGVKALEKQNKENSFLTKALILNSQAVSTHDAQGVSDYSLRLTLKVLSERSSDQVILEKDFYHLPRKSILNLQKDTYFIGNKIDVIWRKKRPESVDLPRTHSLGPFLFGFLPGGLMILIGIATFFRKKSPTKRKN